MEPRSLTLLTSAQKTPDRELRTECAPLVQGLVGVGPVADAPQLTCPLGIHARSNPGVAVQSGVTRSNAVPPMYAALAVSPTERSSMSKIPKPNPAGPVRSDGRVIRYRRRV